MEKGKGEELGRIDIEVIARRFRRDGTLHATDMALLGFRTRAVYLLSSRHGFPVHDCYGSRESG